MKTQKHISKERDPCVYTIECNSILKAVPKMGKSSNYQRQEAEEYKNRSVSIVDETVIHQITVGI